MDNVLELLLSTRGSYHPTLVEAPSRASIAKIPDNGVVHLFLLGDSPVVVVVTWWWMRNRARLRLHGGETEAHLTLRESIKERDEVCIYYSYKVFDEMHNG